MPRKVYIVTDYDGTFTNTHDVVSGAVLSSDSPVIIEQIGGRDVVGVFGCTHRNTDGYHGFTESAPMAAMFAQPPVEFDPDNLANQKVASIDARLRAVCIAARVPFYGTSTEYDRDGLFTGLPLVIAAEEALNNDRNLHAERKLDQREKNGQLQQIIDFIVKYESYSADDEIIIKFYDDKVQIHTAIAAQGLVMPVNMRFESYQYKYSLNGTPLTLNYDARGTAPLAPAAMAEASHAEALDTLGDEEFARRLAEEMNGRVVSRAEVRAEQEARQAPAPAASAAPDTSGDEEFARRLAEEMNGRIVSRAEARAEARAGTIRFFDNPQDRHDAGGDLRHQPRQ